MSSSVKKYGNETECAIEEERGFRRGRACMDQGLSVRQTSKKYVANEKDAFWKFMDQEGKC